MAHRRGAADPGHLLPHAQAEDHALYPVAQKVMGAPEATDTMRRDHVGVGRFTDELGVLRPLLEAMSGWLVAGASPEGLRDRAAMIAVALEDHSRREEQQLFEPLRSRSEGARRLTGMMEVIHDEVRGLFEEIAAPSREPKDNPWTILQLTEAHFVKEEEEVFSRAESLFALDELLRLGSE